MQIIISIMIVGLLWMVYDLINAPEVDDDENFIDSDSEEIDALDTPPTKLPKRVKSKKTSRIED